MNLQAINVANITGFLLILSLLISQMITFKNSRLEDRIFSWMMYLVLVACLIEPLTFYVDGRPGRHNYLINLLGNTYLYGANVVGSFLFCVYVDLILYKSGSRAKRIYNKLAFFVVILLLSLLLNLSFGYYFYVGPDNVYHRQALAGFFYIYTLLCCIYSISILYIHRYKHGKVAFFPIYMYLVPIVTGSILQMFIYGVSLAWLGTAIGVVSLYMSMLSQSSYLDALTGLYNRLFFKQMMYRIKKKSIDDYYGIMLDMDNFKSINDNYGHSAGDRALIDAAYIFRQATEGTTASVFRYAGDEFVILIKTDSEEDVTDLEKRLHEEADKFNAGSERAYKVGFSIGHDRFDCYEDTQDSFLKKIDTAMYINKEQRRKESGIERRGKTD